MEGLERQPHIQLTKEQVQPVVVAVGDPARVDAVLKHCDSYEELAFSREYRSANAVYKGQKFTVISHGIGVSGAMICFEELVKLGAKVIIRAGTCGSLKPKSIFTGDVFVPYAVARDTDSSDFYLPKGFPAVSTPRIYQSLLKSAEELNIPVKSGIGLSNGLFYPLYDDFVKNLERWGKVADIVEFEFQALFLVGSARGIETGGIATVDGSPIEWDKSNYDPSGAACEKGKSDMLLVVVDTCAKLSKEFSA